MYCENCGSTLAENTPFCPQCGVQLRDSSHFQTNQLLKRALLFLEEDNLGKADDYCEQVLDLEPENAEAYIIKLMIRTKSKKYDDLAFAEESYADWQSYKNALRFANDKLKEKLIAYLQSTEENIRIKEEEAQRQEQERIEAELYNQNNNWYRTARIHDLENASSYELEKAINCYSKIPNFLDANQRLLSCQERVRNLKQEQTAQRLEEFRKAQRKKQINIGIGCATVVLAIIIVYIICLNVQQSRVQEAAKIEEALFASCFEGTYTTSKSNGSFTAVTSMTQNDVSLQFRANNEVLIQITSHHGKGVYYKDQNGDRIWDKTTYDSQTFPYKVVVSFWGNASIIIDNQTYQLQLDASNFPLAMSDSKTTYKRIN